MHLLYTTSCAGSNTVCHLTSIILNSYSCKNGPYSDNDLVAKLFFLWSFIVLVKHLHFFLEYKAFIMFPRSTFSRSSFKLIQFHQLFQY